MPLCRSTHVVNGVLSSGTGGFAATSLFGQTQQPQQQPQQAASLFKPFGQPAATPNTGFSFGNTNTMGQPNTSSMVSYQSPHTHTHNSQYTVM